MTGAGLAYAALQGLRRGLPAVTVLLAILLDLLPARSGLVPMAPSLLLSVACYWMALRPELMPAGLLFLLGLVADAAGGQPLGLTPLALLAGHGALEVCRRVLYLRSFGGVWLAFVVMAAASLLAGWLVASLWQVRLLSPGPSLATLVLSVAFFPVAAWCLGLVLNLVPVSPHAPGR